MNDDLETIIRRRQDAIRGRPLAAREKLAKRFEGIDWTSIALGAGAWAVVLIAIVGAVFALVSAR